MKHSPGCKCCRPEGCQDIRLLWKPSSPYDRGEYTDNDQWKPYTEYLQGDQFWAPSTDRNGDLQKFLYTAPVTMFSGGGWTNAEESRYSRGRGISYHDGLDDFELFGDGWPTDQIRLHEALQTNRLREGQGIVSRQEFESDNWQIDWSCIVITPKYDDMEMESLTADIRLMGSVEYDRDVDDRPTSGIVTVISKASANERRIKPYPEQCIPSCETETEEVWNPDDPQCGPKPPFGFNGKVEHGTFVGDNLNLSDAWGSNNDYFLTSRSVQPENGVVVGTLDVETQRQYSPRGEDGVLNLHDVYVLVDCFVRPDCDFNPTYNNAGFENYKAQNAVTVVTKGGLVTQGGESFMVEAGDIIQITDFTKLEEGQLATDPDPAYGFGDEAEDGAFTHIPADEIVEEDRTCYVDQPSGKEGPTSFNFEGVEVRRSLEQFTGRRIAAYVDKLSDIDQIRTRDEDYSLKFSPTVARLMTTATVERPTCVPAPTFECECRPMIAALSGIDIDQLYAYGEGGIQFLNSGNPEEFIDAGLEVNAGLPGLPRVTEDETFITKVSSSGELQFSPIIEIPSPQDQDCLGRAARGVYTSSWSIWKINQEINDPGGGREISPTYYFRLVVSGVIEHSELRIIDCIGKRDKVVLARSAVCAQQFFTFGGERQAEWTADTDGDGDIDIIDDPNGLDPTNGGQIFLTQEAAEADLERRKGILIADMAEYIQGWLCRGARFNGAMNRIAAPFLNRQAGIDTDGDGDINLTRSWAWGFPYSATRTEYSLARGAGSGCGNVATLVYPSQAEIDAGMYRYGRFFDPAWVGGANFINGGQTSVISTQ